MLAIVCDCCGKTKLLADEELHKIPDGYSVLSRGLNGRDKIDLCEECREKLMAAVRKE